MARPIKDGLDYFPHDVDASQDEKIAALEGLHGLEGYAIYFKLLERIYRQGGKLKFEEGFSEAETMRILAKGFGIIEARIQETIQTCLRVGLFDKGGWDENKVLTSTGILKRCGQVFEKREVDRGRLSDTKTPRELSDNRVTITPIVKERKGNIVEIVTFLNTTCKTAYKDNTPGTVKAINARLDEGNTVDDFKAVITFKHKEWANDPKMRQYLCPDTLFRPSHFEKYLNASRQVAPQVQKPSPPKMSADEEEFQKLRMSLIQRGSENT